MGWEEGALQANHVNNCKKKMSIKWFKSVDFWAKKREYMTKLVVSKYRSIGSQSIGDTAKNRAGTTDTSIPSGTSTSIQSFSLRSQFFIKLEKS